MKARPEEQVDHRDINGFNNLKSNLRLCKHFQNSCNRKSWGKTSKYKGVSWITEYGKWRAGIRWKWKMYHLGYFDNEEDAAIVYNVAAQLMFGEFAYLNNV